MSDAALENLKKDTGALAAAYRDAGGKGGDGHHHNHCPFCGSDDAFMLGFGQNGNAVFACYKAGCKAGPKDGKKTGGTIVDLVMLQRAIDSKAACKFVLERYANAARDSKSANAPMGATSGRNNSSSNPQNLNSERNNSNRAAAPAQQRKGKLHLTIDDAIGAARFGIASRKKDGGPVYRQVEIFKYWKYTDERGEPQLATVRFNTIKAASGDVGKEFVPVHRDGAGWRVGLGPWGKVEKRCPLYRLAAAVKALAEAGRN